MKAQADKLNLAPLVNQLLEKSTPEKLKWQPTVSRKAFVVSVGKDVSFRVSEQDATEEDQWGQPYTSQIFKLALLDEKGQPVWDVYDRDLPAGLLERLYETARRIGNNVDERVAVALSALEKL
jgi:hypothetical protein